MAFEFEEESLETLTDAIKGTDNLNFALFAFTYWGFIYGVMSLFTDNISNAILAGIIISIIGICSLINLLLEFLEYSLFKSHPKNRNIKRILLILVISLLIFLDLKGFIRSGIIITPLDFLTNYLFFALLLVPMSEGALDIITVDYKNKMQNFIGLNFDSGSEKKLTFIVISIIISIILAGAYLVFPSFYDVLNNNNTNILFIFILLPVLLYVTVTRFRTSTLEKSLVGEGNKQLNYPSNSPAYKFKETISRAGDVNLVHLFELLLHIGAMAVLVIFMYRAWLIYNKIENGETIEILTISFVVISAILYSANKIRKMKFSSPEILSEYFLGMVALAFGGVVFAILFNLKTSIGFLSMDVAMTFFYVVQSIAIAIALVISAVRNLIYKKHMENRF